MSCDIGNWHWTGVPLLLTGAAREPRLAWVHVQRQGLRSRAVDWAELSAHGPAGIRGAPGGQHGARKYPMAGDDVPATVRREGRRSWSVARTFA
jgi:hypothetical protein